MSGKREVARRRLAAVSAALATTLGTSTLVLAPANAAQPGDGPPSGHKHRVLRLVQDYFVERDKGWLGPQATSLGSGRFASGLVAREPAGAGAGLARIADEVEDERGLRATQVQTGFVGEPTVQIRGHSATVLVDSATLLTWNDAALGESSLSDVYRVRLERDKQTWRIVQVEYVDPPTTEESAARSQDSHPRSRVQRAPESGHASKSASAHPPAADSQGEMTASRTYSYDRKAAAAYANRWSLIDLSPGPTPRYNPDYDHVWGDAGQVDYTKVNDCTNFASQMLYAGGWPKVEGVFPGNVENWTDDTDGPWRASETWTVAYMLWRFAIESGRGERWSSGLPGDAVDMWKLQPGDLLFADWDPNGHWDGKIDHAMLISGTFTELGFTEPTYSQHTPHRHNMPLSIGIKIATSDPPPVDPGNGMGGQGRKVKYYPVHIKDSFTVD